MIVSIDTTQPLSPTDRLLLRGLLGDSEPRGGTQAPPAAQEPSEVPSEAAETPSGPSADLLEEAVALGTKLVRSKQGAKVRAALEKIGVEKITALDNDADIRAFLAEVE